MTTVETRQELAEYAHEAWSGWIKYMFGKAIPYKPGNIQAKEGALIIPAWAVERWERQAKTPYNELPEDEKNSDLAEADQMLSIFSKEAA